MLKSVIGKTFSSPSRLNGTSMVELSRVPTGSRHTMILVMWPLISWAYVQGMLEPTQLWLEMHLERHNCLQQWKWKVSECNCDQICSVLLVVDMSCFISQLFLLQSRLMGTGVFEHHVACIHVTVCFSQIQQYAVYVHVTACFVIALPFLGKHTRSCTPLLGKVKLKLPVHIMKPYWGSRGMAPLILNLAAGWRWVINIMPWPLLPWESTLVCIDYEPEWSLELVWKIWRCLLKYLELMKMWKSEMTM